MADDTPKKEEKTFLQKAGGVIIDFADWLGEKLGEDRSFRAICDDMGLDVKKTPEFPKLTLDGIKDYVTKPSPGLDAWFGVIADITKLVDESIEAFDAQAFTSRAGGCEAPDPIFIVGMPRAGSTLVEQILSSHSLVEGTTELPDLPAVAREGGHYPKSVLDLSKAGRRARGEDYLKRASVQRRTAKPFFIDKLPNNWMFVPAIQLFLPNAKIIDVRRHPMACCFSNFRQHFARGQNFTYALEDVGKYYADYVRLLAHVDSVLPGRVHRVIYERMVDDTEAEVRALLAHCGLEFEPACLEFHKTERAVRTPSSEQVRRPIYRDATDEWRAYEGHLDPLKAVLGSVLDAYPDAPASFVQR